MQIIVKQILRESSQINAVLWPYFLIVQLCKHGLDHHSEDFIVASPFLLCVYCQYLYAHTI